MEYRLLGLSDLKVSVVALGGGAFGADPAVWGLVDDNESIATIHRAIDLGINLVETSPTYGRGHSEQIIGKAIQGRRDRVLIATKCGLIRKNGNAGLIRCLRPESIRAECEESLRRLRIDTIDLYQMHRPDPATPIADSVEALLRLREEGKVNAVGLCEYGHERLGHARRAGPVSSLQGTLSMLDREPREELLFCCAEYKVGFLACAPLSRGLLAGHMTSISRFKDLRAADPRFAGDGFVRRLNLVQCLTAIAQRVGCTTAQLALRWVLQQTGVTAVVAGAKRISQVQENAGAGSIMIPSERMEEIDRLLAEQA